MRQRVLDVLRRLLWVRSYEVALVPAGANGAEDFLDGVKALPESDTALDGLRWERLGEAITALGVGLRSALGNEIQGTDEALSDALDAVVDGLKELGGPRLESAKDPLCQVTRAVRDIEVETLLLQSRDPEAAKAIRGFCQEIAEVLPASTVSSGSPGFSGTREKPSGQKPGGSKTPPEGYPKDRDAYLDPDNYKYPIDTEKRVRAAITYLSRERPNGPGKYTRNDLVWMWERLRRAAEGYNIEVAESTGVKTQAHAGTLSNAAGGATDAGCAGPVGTSSSGELCVESKTTSSFGGTIVHLVENSPEDHTRVGTMQGAKVLGESQVTAEAGKETNMTTTESSEAAIEPIAEPIAEPAVKAETDADPDAKPAVPAEPDPAPVAEVKSDLSAADPAPESAESAEPAELLGPSPAEKAIEGLQTEMLAAMEGLKGLLEASLGTFEDRLGKLETKASEAVASAQRACDEVSGVKARQHQGIPGTAPMVDLEPASTVPDRSDIDTEDYSRSSRLKDLRAKKGGFSPCF